VNDFIPEPGWSSGIFVGVRVILEAIFAGSALFFTLLIFRRSEARKRSRREMKQHVQKIELSSRA
jgi:hypothetical protein